MAITVQELLLRIKVDPETGKINATTAEVEKFIAATNKAGDGAKKFDLTAERLNKSMNNMKDSILSTGLATTGLNQALGGVPGQLMNVNNQIENFDFLIKRSGGDMNLLTGSVKAVSGAIGVLGVASLAAAAAFAGWKIGGLINELLGLEEAGRRLSNTFEKMSEGTTTVKEDLGVALMQGVFPFMNGISALETSIGKLNIPILGLNSAVEEQTEQQKKLNEQLRQSLILKYGEDAEKLKLILNATADELDNLARGFRNVDNAVAAGSKAISDAFTELTKLRINLDKELRESQLPLSEQLKRNKQEQDNLKALMITSAGEQLQITKNKVAALIKEEFRLGDAIVSENKRAAKEAEAAAKRAEAAWTQAVNKVIQSQKQWGEGMLGLLAPFGAGITPQMEEYAEQLAHAAEVTEELRIKTMLEKDALERAAEAAGEAAAAHEGLMNTMNQLSAIFAFIADRFGEGKMGAIFSGLAAGVGLFTEAMKDSTVTTQEWGFIVGNAFMTAADQIEGSVGKIIGAIGSMVAISGQAFDFGKAVSGATGSGALGGAVTGGMIGASTGSTGAAIGGIAGGAIGSIFGPVGTMVGAYLGSAIGGAIEKLFTEDLPKDVSRYAHTLGFSITDALSEEIAKLADEMGDIRAATFMMTSDIADEVGITTANIEKFISSIRTGFSLLQEGLVDASEVTSVLEDMFPRLADVATDEFGRISASLKEIITLSEQAGLKVAAISEFLINEATRGLEGLTGLTERWASLVMSKFQRLSTILPSPISDGTGGGPPPPTSEIDPAMSRFRIKSQRDLDEFANIALSYFNELIQNGFSVREAMEALGPAISPLIDIMKELGLETEGAFGNIVEFQKLLEKFPKAFEALENGVTVLTSLDNMGRLTADSFDQIERAMKRAFVRIIQDGKLSRSEWDGISQGMLLLIKLSEEYGFKLDGVTKKIRDMAKEQGFLEDDDAFPSMEESLLNVVDGINLLNTSVQELIVLFKEAAMAAAGLGGVVSGIGDSIFREGGLISPTGKYRTSYQGLSQPHYVSQPFEDVRVHHGEWIMPKSSGPSSISPNFYVIVRIGNKDFRGEVIAVNQDGAELGQFAPATQRARLRGRG